MLNDYAVLAETYKRTDLKPDKHFSILPTVLTAVGDLSHKTVLDVGCGSGFFSRAFAGIGATKVIGIDSSREQIAVAQKENRERITYIVSDAFVDPLPKADVICVPFISNYLRSQSELVSFFKKVKQALSAMGVAIFVFDIPKGLDLSRFGAKKSVEGSLQDGSPMKIELYDGNIQPICVLRAYYFTPETIEVSLEQAGFSLVEKIQPTVSEEGTRAYSQEFWDGYLKETELGYYRCLA